MFIACCPLQAFIGFSTFSCAKTLFRIAVRKIFVFTLLTDFWYAFRFQLFRSFTPKRNLCNVLICCYRTCKATILQMLLISLKRGATTITKAIHQSPGILISPCPHFQQKESSCLILSVKVLRQFGQT